MTQRAPLASLAARIEQVAGLLPEHVTCAASDETDAALVDGWARVLPLRAHAVIGRDPANEVAVLQASVSRRHAELRYDVDADVWTIADLGSRNGTFVETVALSKPRALADRQLIAIGDVGFVFVLDRATLPAAGPVTYSSTAQSTRRIGELRLSQPTSEGQGVVAHGDASVSLGSTQFALLRLLAERYLETRDAGEELRGYVRSVELIANLPWNTPHPEDNHVKQQIRRVRRALERLGLTNAIESRHGFGYRLRVAPILDATC